MRLNLIDVYLLLLLTLKQNINYLFPIVIFVSIVPILVSVDYFEGIARNTGAEKAQTDAKVYVYFLLFTSYATATPFDFRQIMDLTYNIQDIYYAFLLSYYSLLTNCFVHWIPPLPGHG